MKNFYFINPNAQTKVILGSHPQLHRRNAAQERRMSTRPVPTRESPWGIHESDTIELKAHRCNDRLEDIVQACFEGNPFKTVPGPFKLFWQCMNSNPGEEPTEPFYYLELDPPKRPETESE
ncbi:uncharacterized protein LOC122043082 [Zingiber officinale]|uniref:uncharacterized protein LOC122043082 n=1 Tax=Zingiber officinale TaxID=94328 RepID=UPI001C4B6CFC|nr:uncharacterized protein LOC122043082 [Zingiber officinale]